MGWHRLRVESGRDAEFEAYVRRSRDRLVRLAALLAAGDVHRGEDAVQTALTRVYLAWPRVAGDERIDSYVRRAVVNAVIDEHRRRWNRHELPTAEQPEVPAADRADATPSNETLAALSALPPRMRSVIVLRFFEDCSVVETARLLGCSEGTVKSQCARALVKLRRHLDPAETAATSTVGGTAETRIA